MSLEIPDTKSIVGCGYSDAAVGAAYPFLVGRSSRAAAAGRPAHMTALPGVPGHTVDERCMGANGDDGRIATRSSRSGYPSEQGESPGNAKAQVAHFPDRRVERLCRGEIR